MNEPTQKIFGLRIATRYNVFDPSGKRVRGAEIVLRLIAKKRCYIAKRSEADASTSGFSALKTT